MKRLARFAASCLNPGTRTSCTSRKRLNEERRLKNRYVLSRESLIDLSKVSKSLKENLIALSLITDLLELSHPLLWNTFL
jgi:hypothetical protein